MSTIPKSESWMEPTIRIHDKQRAEQRVEERERSRERSARWFGLEWQVCRRRGRPLRARRPPREVRPAVEARSDLAVPMGASRPPPGTPPPAETPCFLRPRPAERRPRLRLWDHASSEAPSGTSSARPTIGPARGPQRAHHRMPSSGGRIAFEVLLLGKARSSPPTPSCSWRWRAFSLCFGPRKRRVSGG